MKHAVYKQHSENEKNMSKKQIHLFSLFYGRKRSKCLEVDVLEIIEVLLSDQLKEMCDQNNIETNPLKSARLFHQLGKIYTQRSPNKLCLVKSAILYNAALTRMPENEFEFKKDLNELFSHVIDLAGAKKLGDSSLQIADVLQNTMQTYRKTIKKQVEDISQVTGESNTQSFQTKLVFNVEKLQKEIYEFFSGFMESITKYCLSAKGNPPCRCALVGMGSLARKEVTPYSDFEHIILLEEGVHEKENYQEKLEYFRWVSVIFHITVANLRETIVPSVALPYLNNPWHKNWNWFYDAHTRKGISFDGMFPSACKFPLGRAGKPGRLNNSAELIRPVGKMLKYLSSNKELKNGYHLADVLTSTCFVCGDEFLHKLFAQQADKIGMKKELMEKQLMEDIKKFSPIDSLSNVSPYKKWNMKGVVYRSTTLFFAALAKYFRVKSLGNTTFNTKRKLVQTEIISQTFAESLLFAFAVACYIRLSVYCKEIDKKIGWNFQIIITITCSLLTSLKYWTKVLQSSIFKQQCSFSEKRADSLA